MEGWIDGWMDEHGIMWEIELTRSRHSLQCLANVTISIVTELTYPTAAHGWGGVTVLR